MAQHHKAGEILITYTDKTTATLPQPKVNRLGKKVNQKQSFKMGARLP